MSCLFIIFFVLFFSIFIYFQVFFNITDDGLFCLDFGVSKPFDLFLFLVLMVSFLIMMYTSYYMYDEYNYSYYVLLMLIFITSMCFLLVSKNLITLALSWEGLGLSSFFLINYNQAWESHNNSLVTLLTMRLGDFMLFMFMGSLFFMYFKMIPNLLPWEMVFFVMCMTKSAIYPFSGWLPKAMSAPTPTSALVHSSTLVTAGLVVLIMFSDVFMSNFMLTLSLIFGVLTLLLGSFAAMAEMSVKKVVAYSTLSQMGLSLIVLGLGNFYLGIINMVAHGFAKSMLFMEVGYMMHWMNSQQNSRKWGMFGNTPSIMQIHTLCTLLSLCGISYTNGMFCKENILEMMLSVNWKILLLSFLLFFVFLTFIYSILIFKTIFSISHFSLLLNHKSLFMITVLNIEGLFLFFYFSWLFSNSLEFSINFNFSEVFFTSGMIYSVFLGFKFITDLFYYTSMKSLMMVNTGNQWTLWAKFPMILTPWLEGLLYSMAVIFMNFSLNWSYKFKFYSSGYLNIFFAIFVLIFILIYIFVVVMTFQVLFVFVFFSTLFLYWSVISTNPLISCLLLVLALLLVSPGLIMLIQTWVVYLFFMLFVTGVLVVVFYFTSFGTLFPIWFTSSFFLLSLVFLFFMPVEFVMFCFDWTFMTYNVESLGIMVLIIISLVLLMLFVSYLLSCGGALRSM